MLLAVKKLVRKMKKIVQMQLKEETTENIENFKEKLSFSLHCPRFYYEGWGQQFEIEPQIFTVFNHLYYLAWVKSQVIPPKIFNILLIYQVLGRPTSFFLIWFGK